VEDETRNAELNGNRNPEWWGDFSQLQIQIIQKSQCEFVPRDTSEFKSNQNLNSTLYREIQRYLIFSILTSLIFHGTGCSNIVKAESSGEDHTATEGLVSNLPHPRVNKTKQHTPQVGLAVSRH